jgi:hypothetical protein
MNPQPENTPQAGGATSAASLGIIGRLSGIYFSPSETFPAIGKAPKFVIAMILTGIIAAISSVALTNRIGMENLVRKQMEPMVERGWMTQEQADLAVQQSTTGVRGTISKVQGPVFAAIGYGILILVVTALFKLISMVLGAENEFKQLLGVTAWTFLAISILHTALFLIVLYLKSPDDLDLFNPVGSNLGAVIGLVAEKAPKFLKSLASWVDVFGIWRIALLSIGYAAVSRKLKTGTAAICLLILYFIGALIFSAIASVFS